MGAAGGSGRGRDAAAFAKTKLVVLPAGLPERGLWPAGPRILSQAPKRFSQGRGPLPPTSASLPRGDETCFPLLDPFPRASLRSRVCGAGREEVFSPVGWGGRGQGYL